jgi:diguanylate cyclase (GGDEF)-like protein/PAS domain S-box-containing protein
MINRTEHWPTPAAIGIDDVEIAVRKEFLEFTEVDVALLKELHAHLEARRDSFSEVFYRHLQHFPHLLPLLGNTEKLNHLKHTQSVYFSQLTEGEYGPKYVDNRLHVGIAHQRVGLTPQWYIGAYRKYLHELMPGIYQIMGNDAEKCIAVYSALLKIVFFDMGLALDTYFYADHQVVVREKRFSNQIISDMPSGLAVLDPALNVRQVNKALVSMFELESAEACFGKPVAKLLGTTDNINSALEGVLENGEKLSGLFFERNDGQGNRYYLADISRAVTEEGQTLLLFMMSDITTYKKAEERAQYLAQYDVLTGLPNRGLIYDRIDYTCTMAQRTEGVVATMLIDLDRFKLVNDSLGSTHGDEVLKQAGNRLSSCLRESDTVGRTGGNEFVMILLSMNAAEDAAVVAKKILEVLAAPFHLAGLQLHLTASIGIAVAPDDGKNSEELLRSAAAALHQAKNEGRNQFCFFQPEMNLRAQRDIQLESGLHRAAKNFEFELHYQPKIDLRSGEICGVEALLRWQHPERGRISPADFIPLLEENGLIVPVGTWVLRTACAQAKTWQRMGIKPCRVAVNLSAVQFHRQDLCEVVQQALQETGLDVKFLELEITESIIMKNVDRAVQTLHALKSLGVRLSVDDFGTGHSSLNYLKRFAVDVLKIDQSFIRDITTDADDALITRTIIDLAHNMRMQVIAEGVESQAQLDFLLHNNCDEMQGYYYSKPLPVAACTELFKKGRLLSLTAD